MGGGIAASRSNASITNTRFAANRGPRGAALSASAGSNVSAVNCSWRGNMGLAGGAVMVLQSALRLEACELEGNAAGEVRGLWFGGARRGPLCTGRAYELDGNAAEGVRGRGLGWGTVLGAGAPEDPPALSFAPAPRPPPPPPTHHPTTPPTQTHADLCPPLASHVSQHRLGPNSLPLDTTTRPSPRRCPRR